MALGRFVSTSSRDCLYVCPECNRLIYGRRKAKSGNPLVDRLCACGHELIMVRSVSLTFFVGIAWACLVLLLALCIARLAPELKGPVRSVGLALVGALTCSRAFEASRYSHRPKPAALVTRQVYAEAAGAFLALVAGGIVFFD